MNDRPRSSAKRSNPAAIAAALASSDPDHRFACAEILFDERNYAEARRLYSTIDTDQVPPSLRAEAVNSLAVLDGLDDRHHAARAGFRRALAIDPTCENARRNLAMLESCGCGAEDDETSPTLGREDNASKNVNHREHREH